MFTILLYIFLFTKATQACSVSMDLVIAIDASGSVGLTNFKSCLEFVKDIVSAMNTDTGNVRIGMMTFDGTSKIIFHLNADMNNLDMKMAVENTPYTGGLTNMDQAIKKMIDEMFVEENGDRYNIRNVIFLVTDGKSSLDPIPIAEAAHRQGINIYVLGVGRHTSLTQLDGMVSKPTTKHLFQKSSYGDLSKYGNTIALKICQVQAAKEPPCSKTKGETCRFPLKRGYMVPFQSNTLTGNLRLLADCISLCIDHFKHPLRCKAFNFCQPDDTLSGTCQIAFPMEEWHEKLIANTTCVFGISPFKDAEEDGSE